MITAIAVSLLFVSVPGVFSADLAAVSRGEISFSFDEAVFDMGVTDTLLLEIYQEVGIGQFSRDSLGASLFTTEVTLASEEGDTLLWDIRNTSVEWTQTGSALNCLLLPVTAGDWELTMRVTDTNNGLQGVAERRISVDSPKNFSDLELARTIMPAQEGTTNPLCKGNIVVFPAASTRFTVPAESMMYTYQELYSLGGEELLRYSKLLSPEGVVVFARPPDVVAVPQGAETVALTDSLDLSVVRETGLYTLSVTYVQSGDTVAVFEKPMVVEVVFPSSQPEQAEEVFSERILSALPLLLNQEESQMYSRLDEDGKTRYYDDYWNSRPGGHAEYLQRNHVASARYRAIGKEGWQTDRGRVYIVYGEPDEIEVYPFTTTQAPYEVWYYYGNQQDMFVFADLMGSGDYFQVYSTVPGEVSHDNWRGMLQNINSGSRQEEGNDF